MIAVYEKRASLLASPGKDPAVVLAHRGIAEGPLIAVGLVNQKPACELQFPKVVTLVLVNRL